MLKKNIFYFIIVFVVFLIDRISKILIVNFSEEIRNNEIYQSKFLNFQLIWNEGIAFGLLSFENDFIYHSISLLITLIILILIIMLIKSKNVEKIGFALISGGAIGNLFDRIMFKSVPDFIDFHVNNFHWFIFNIADIFITIGVLWLILAEFFVKKNMKLIKFLFLSLILSVLLISCKGEKQTLSIKNKKNVDEFLIEKKNPLVLPPDYSELPEPREFKKDDINEDKNLDLSGVLSGATGDKSQNTTNEIERSISDILKKK